MNREAAWSFGKLVMRQIVNTGYRDEHLLLCPDGTVVWRFPDEKINDRIWFDPWDWRLHFIFTIVQRTWHSPVECVALIARRLSRHASLPGYFTVEPGWGITYRSSISLLPLPVEQQLRYFIELWDYSWRFQYEKLLAQIPADPTACALLDEKTRYLDRVPGGMVYPCGTRYNQTNDKYELMTKGYFDYACQSQLYTPGHFR